MDPIFERDGDHVVATELARGPWDPASCHGGAPAGLLAAMVDAVPSLTAMQGVRLTYDLLRPVPLGPLVPATRVVRDGKRVQVVEAWLTTRDDVELIRCRALRIRVGDVDLPADADPDDPALEPDADAAANQAPRVGDGWGTGFWTAMEIRPVHGSVLGDPGPGAAWFRLNAPLADGLTLTPLARAAATADFGNGLAPPLPIDRFLYLNPDLTVHLHRLPEGEWVSLRSRSIARSSGVGLTTSTLGDHRGRIGGTFQSLFVAAREPTSTD